MSNIAIMQDAIYTSGMSAALGAYLKTLREGRSLPPKSVLAQLTERLGKKIDHSRLWRAENNEAKGWPEGDFLAALLDIIGGSLDDIAWIQRHPGATSEEGQLRAKLRLAVGAAVSEEERTLIEQLTRLTGDRRRAAIVVLRDLLAAEEQNEAT